MADFITPLKQWDFFNFRNVVNTDDFEVISGIPISGHGTADRWTWHLNKHGIDLFKSGYKVAMRQKSLFLNQ